MAYQPITNPLPVTVSTALPAGAAVIGAVTQSGTWNVTNISGTVSLPTGASTSALQTTGNASLSSIDGKLPALGQALAAASVPVVLTAAQLVTLTPPAAITGFSTSALQTTGNASLASIDGKITAVNTGAVTVSTALPAGAAIIGKVGIDQTTPGTTNLVSIGTNGTVAIGTALPAGANAIGKLAANSGVTIGTVEIAAAQTLATVTTVSTVTNLSQFGGQAIAMGTGVRSAGTLRVTIATDDLVPTTTADTSASGNLTALNQAVTLTGLQGKTAGLIQLSGTWAGAVQFEGSNDGFATTTILNTTQSGGAAPNTTPISANGDYRALGVVNYASLRVRCSSFTSGTIVVFLKVSDANGIQPVISSNAAGFLATVVGKVSIDQTTPGLTNAISNQADYDIQLAILTELRVISTLLQVGLSVRDEPADLREDYSRSIN